MPKSPKKLSGLSSSEFLPDQALQGEALIKETCRRIRAAKGLWDAHRNAACRQEREQAIALYNQLTPAQKDKIPQQLRIWLRYRSEKYFGAHQTPPGSSRRSGGAKKSTATKTPKKTPKKT
jgi:hypothetical protein